MALDQLKALKARMEEMREQIKTEAKAAFASTTKEIFAQHPTLEQFQWHQYTPYFNDGDECTFSAHTDTESISINEEDAYEVSRTSRWNGSTHIPVPADQLHPLQGAQKEISVLLNAIGDDFLKAMFGDHSEITAKRDGTVTVESYCHD